MTHKSAKDNVVQPVGTKLRWQDLGMSVRWNSGMERQKEQEVGIMGRTEGCTLGRKNESKREGAW